MSIRFAWLAAATLGSGCSLILNTDDLPARSDGPPGQIDAGMPDSMLPDANPGRQTLCAAWTTTGGATGTFALPEARSCIDVLFIPD